MKLPRPTPLQIKAYALGSEHTVFIIQPPVIHRSLPLSPAERQVAALVLEGRTNAAIADRRGVSLSTVAKQVASMFERLGVGSRAELIAALLQPAEEPHGPAGLATPG